MKIDERQAQSQFSKPAVEILRRGGVDIELISMPPYRAMHHKFVVIDDRTVLTGSYNFSSAATEDNWENMVKIEQAKVARSYRSQWQAIRSKKKEKK
jgi:phosphatidylserine/phosphatidylglycerophosphate/cardiolipin synthase-like enzyme